MTWQTKISHTMPATVHEEEVEKWFIVDLDYDKKAESPPAHQVLMPSVQPTQRAE
jgi:hypothetical protein